MSDILSQAEIDKLLSGSAGATPAPPAEPAAVAVAPPTDSSAVAPPPAPGAQSPNAGGGAGTPSVPTGGSSGGASATPGNPQLDRILDIPIQVAVELGRARVLVQDLLKLHKGSIIELGKDSGAPLEILVNGKVVANGEVVVVNDKFGVRISEIGTPAQRLKPLQS